MNTYNNNIPSGLKYEHYICYNHVIPSGLKKMLKA